MSPILSTYNSIGPVAFSLLACQQAPYFLSINPMFQVLRRGHAQVHVPFAREITNHLGTVHAIAMCNAAELAAGMMTTVSIPDGARWIPSGMTVEYLAKARTSVTARALGDEIDWNSPVTSGFRWRSAMNRTSWSAARTSS